MWHAISIPSAPTSIGSLGRVADEAPSDIFLLAIYAGRWERSIRREARASRWTPISVKASRASFSWLSPRRRSLRVRSSPGGCAAAARRPRSSSAGRNARRPLFALQRIREHDVAAGRPAAFRPVASWALPKRFAFCSQTQASVSTFRVVPHWALASLPTALERSVVPSSPSCEGLPSGRGRAHLRVPTGLVSWRMPRAVSPEGLWMEPGRRSVYWAITMEGGSETPFQEALAS